MLSNSENYVPQRGLVGLLCSVTALPRAAFFLTPHLLFTTSCSLYPLSLS